jgi:hypothetical protein
MKVLVIIVAAKMPNNWVENIRMLAMHLKCRTDQIDYALISPEEADALPLKYTFRSNKMQLSKISDFICQFKDELSNYDWIVKTRPDLILLDDIDFDNLPHDCINARARVYSRNVSPIRFGLSLEHPCCQGNCRHRSPPSEADISIILDDMLYIFHTDLLQKFRPVIDVTGDMYWTPHGYCYKEQEWFHTFWWDKLGIGKNVIGFNALVLDDHRRIRFRSGHTDGTGSVLDAP